MSFPTSVCTTVMHDEDWALQIATRMAVDLRCLLGKPGNVAIALSGGSTPEPVYALLAQMNLDWARVCILQVDERMVPAGDPRSNATMIRRAMSPALARGAGAIWMDAWVDSQDPAKGYAREIGPKLPIGLLVLGMGEDGHTASLFPGDGMTASPETVVSVAAKPTREARLSLGPEPLLRAECTHIVARGASKAPALRRLCSDVGTLEETPARLARRSALEEGRDGLVTTWVDHPLWEAAGLTP